MTSPQGWYPDPYDASRFRWWNGTEWTQNTTAATMIMPGPPTSAAGRARADQSVSPTLGSRSPVEPARATAAETISRSADERAAIAHELQVLRAQLVETRSRMLLQEIGLYEYAHPLDSSAQYKDRLAELRGRMKECVRKGTAVTRAKRWAINGSDVEGAKMVDDISKLMLRAYNAEAEGAVKTLRPHTLDATLRRLGATRTTISRLGRSMQIEITDEYHRQREIELELTADYLSKVAEEKEAAREERARLKEEAAARKEFEREQARLEKEHAHYEAAITALESKGDTSAASDARAKLEEIDRALKGVIDRSANIRAGYVYVISNLGAFGERVIKIGMTRRLEPMDRVRELGDASVPFRFDVHALIFSDDAVGLETALHHRFAEKRLNLVNLRREYFYATPREVRLALQDLRGDLLTFEEEAEALEWSQSEGVRRRTAEGASTPAGPTGEKPGET